MGRETAGIGFDQLDLERRRMSSAGMIDVLILDDEPLVAHALVVDPAAERRVQIAPPTGDHGVGRGKRWNRIAVAAA